MKILADDNGKPMLDGNNRFVDPFKIIPSIYFEIISIYSDCKKFNCMPFSVGFLEHPAKLIEAFRLIDSQIYEIRERAQKKNNQTK